MKNKIALQNCFIFFTFLLLTLLFAEVTVRILPHFSDKNDLRDYPSRYLMWSIPTFDTDNLGAVSFAKKNSIRDVAVYGNKIEYDMIYETNNFGSADEIDYTPEQTKDKSFAIVGDSFAAGQGGFAWIAEMRKELQKNRSDISIYTFGIPGTGIKHFEKSLRSASKTLNFTDIIILAISDDLFRDYWFPKNDSNHVLFCRNENECIPIAQVIDINATKSEILAKALKADSEKKEQSFRSIAVIDSLYLFLKKSKLLRISKKTLQNYLFQSKRKDINFTPLKNIRQNFPSQNIYFLHVPEKHEVRDDKYVVELKAELESIGIRYVPLLHLYDWSLEMFYFHDPHPNKFGYEKLMSYVKDWILLQET